MLICLGFNCYCLGIFVFNFFFGVLGVWRVKGVCKLKLRLIRELGLRIMLFWLDKIFRVCRLMVNLR